MKTQVEEIDESTVRKISEEMEEPEWLLQERLKSFRKYKELDKPRFKYGLSLYMPIRGADLENLNTEAILNEQLEVGNEEDVEVLTTREALEDEEYEEIIKNYWMKKAYYTGENKITAMHGAFWTNGVIIIVPEGVNGEVRLKFNMEDENSISHVLVLARENSKVHVTEENTSTDLDYGLKSHGIEVFAMEGAKVRYESLQNLSRNVWHFVTKRAVLGKDAQIDWFTGTFGAKHSKVEVSADLAGEGAKANNLGVFLGREDQGFDTYNTAIHTAPHTDSDMDNKGIVTDKAKSIYRGLVKIKEKARDCNGYQKEDTLILSDSAEADAVPNLEIENNDVRCSHGATVGQVDEEKLFYMMSRGLSRKQAEHEIVKGFLGSMISRVKDEELRGEMEEIVTSRM